MGNTPRIETTALGNLFERRCRYDICGSIFTRQVTRTAPDRSEFLPAYCVACRGFLGNLQQARAQQRNTTNAAQNMFHFENATSSRHVATMTEEGATAGKAGAQFDLYNDRAMRCLLFKKTKLAILKCVDLNQVRMTPVLVSNKNDKRFHSQASHSHGRHWLGAPLFRLGVFNAR